MRVVVLFAFLAAATAATAQQRSIIDIDDMVDPRESGKILFMSRLVAGAVHDFVDDYRPLRGDMAFVHVANSLYWRGFQFDWKHTEAKAEEEPGAVRRCGDCSPPIYFPTPPPDDATPTAPLPGAKETLQLAHYRTGRRDAYGIPVMLRYRLTWSYQPIATEIRSAATDRPLERLRGDEQTYGVEAETHLRVRGRDVYGTVVYAANVRRGTTDDRTQHELAYTSRFRGMSYKDVIVLPLLTVGGVTGRGGPALNVIHPMLKASWRHQGTRATLHLVWSPQWTRSGAEGWRATNQLALFVDRALFVTGKR